MPEAVVVSNRSLTVNAAQEDINAAALDQPPIVGVNHRLDAFVRKVAEAIGDQIVIASQNVLQTSKHQSLSELLEPIDDLV
jgi:hypothetical protein